MKTPKTPRTPSSSWIATTPIEPMTPGTPLTPLMTPMSPERRTPTPYPQIPIQFKVDLQCLLLLVFPHNGVQVPIDGKTIVESFQYYYNEDVRTTIQPDNYGFVSWVRLLKSEQMKKHINCRLYNGNNTTRKGTVAITALKRRSADLDLMRVSVTKMVVAAQLREHAASLQPNEPEAGSDGAIIPTSRVQAVVGESSSTQIIGTPNRVSQGEIYDILFEHTSSSDFMRPLIQNNTPPLEESPAIPYPPCSNPLPPLHRTSQSNTMRIIPSSPVETHSGSSPLPDPRLQKKVRPVAPPPPQLSNGQENPKARGHHKRYEEKPQKRFDTVAVATRYVQECNNNYDGNNHRQYPNYDNAFVRPLRIAPPIEDFSKERGQKRQYEGSHRARRDEVYEDSWRKRKSFGRHNGNEEAHGQEKEQNRRHSSHHRHHGDRRRNFNKHTMEGSNEPNEGSKSRKRAKLNDHY